MKLRYKILGGLAAMLAVATIAFGLVLSHDSACVEAPTLPEGTPTILAAAHRCYGSPDVVQLESVEKPSAVEDQVLVRVRATVSAGYDLERLHLEADPATKTIHMSALPEPEILSIDHTLDYYDISEGLFSSFTPDDYNRINKRAKELIREQALNSNLMPAAREQAGKMLELIRFMVESAGWTLVIEGESPGIDQ